MATTLEKNDRRGVARARGLAVVDEFKNVAETFCAVNGWAPLELRSPDDDDHEAAAADNRVAGR